MREDGYAAGITHAANRFEHIGLVHGHVSRRVLADVLGERFVDVLNVALVAEELREVEASGDGAANGLGFLEIDVDFELTQAGGKLGVAFPALGLNLIDPILEVRRGRGVEEVGEQVNRFFAIQAGGDFNAADEFDGGGASGRDGGEVAGQGVVIGDGEGAQALSGRGGNQFRGRVGSVGTVRMSVQVDQVLKMRTMLVRGFLLLFAVFTTACQRKPLDDFLLFEDDHFNALLAFQPTAGTLAGYHQCDDQLEDYSQERIERRIRELETLATRVKQIRAGGGALNKDEAIDAEVLEAQIGAELFDHREMQTWRVNPMVYIGKPSESVDVIIKRAYAPGRERMPSVIARLEQTPRLMEAMKRNVRNPPREFTEIAIQMARSSAVFFGETVPRWSRPFATVSEQEQLEKSAKKAQFAMEEAARWLEQDLLPASQGKFAIGAARFSRKLALEEMVELPLDRLLRMGEETLRRDEERFRAIAAQWAPGKNPAQVMALIADDHPAAEDLLPATRRTLGRVRQFLKDHDLITLTSDAEPTVTETPPFLRSGIFAAMDTPGPYEGKATEAFYYVTPVEPRWDAARQREHLRLFNRPVLEVITIHEAFPGHYVQFLNVARFPTKTRKMVSVASNSEGWAHYGEQMMIEEGYGGGEPKLALAQLSEALLRDCRYVVGIKLHTAGMTVEQGARFFVEHGFQEPANAYEEARRGTYNPTYLYYTLGKLMVYRLRADFQKERGANYTLKSFHDGFVRQGALPFKIMRRLMLSTSGAGQDLL